MNAISDTVEPEARRKRGRPARDLKTILDVAVSVFAREGYACATIEMIATEAAASSATLYKRFTNKHGLFIAVLAHASDYALDIHNNNMAIAQHPFAAIINRLEAHALICCEPQVRGVMRAWIGEMRSHNELGSLFAGDGGQELVVGLIRQLRTLSDSGLVAFPDDTRASTISAAQIMLGIVERLTLMRGLVLGDFAPPLFSTAAIAQNAVRAMVGIWGTSEGKAVFEAIPRVEVALTPSCRENLLWESLDFPQKI